MFNPSGMGGGRPMGPGGELSGGIGGPPMGAMPQMGPAATPPMVAGMPGGGLPMGGDPMGGGMPGDPGFMSSPQGLGLLGAGTSMLGASGQEGGFGEALGAGIGGGLGGYMQGSALQKEAAKEDQLAKILGMQSGIGDAAMLNGQQAMMPGGLGAPGIAPQPVGALGGAPQGGGALGEMPQGGMPQGGMPTMGGLY